jgi:hypothetical protein
VRLYEKKRTNHRNLTYIGCLWDKHPTKIRKSDESLKINEKRDGTRMEIGEEKQLCMKEK